MKKYILLLGWRQTFALILLLTINSWAKAQTYCSTGLGGSIFQSTIDGVSIATTTLNNPTPGNPNLYFSYPATGSTTATLIQGYSYNITITAGSTFSGSNMYIWIDFNNNGIYEPYEFFEIGSGVMGSSTALFTVPTTAHTGLTGLRVRTCESISTLASNMACSNTSTGETEDYLITIDTSAPCSGLPVAGTIGGPDSVCSSQSFSLYISGSTSAVGISYQWKSRPAGSGSFSPLSGATSASYSVSSLPYPTDYKAYVTCGAYRDSTAIFTVYTSSFIHCYCGDSTSLGGYIYTAPIDSVSIVGTTLNNYYTSINPSIFSSYPATGSTTAHLQQGGTYTMAVKVPDYYGGASVGFWIDYNRNGIFDSSEFVAFGASTSFLGYNSISFMVPPIAHIGSTGMRIRSVDEFSSFPSSIVGGDSACSHFTSGETEDYFITIDTTLPCTGMPAAATITGPDSICSAEIYTLTATGYTLAGGTTYQWYSSPSGAGTFTPLYLATGLTYINSSLSVATDYELKITCTVSGLSSTSNIITITPKAFFNCYCDSASLGGYPYNNQLDSVCIETTTLNNGTPYNTNTYSLFPASGNTTAILQQGATYNIVTLTSNPNSSVSLWIDYDHSGTFDATEWTDISDNVIGVALNTFTVPLTALTGTTGMRIRSGNPFSLTSIDACTNEAEGETEDYWITIDTTLPCTGVPTGTISGPDSVCASDSFQLTVEGFTLATGLVYQWFSCPAGTGAFTPITGATNPIYESSGITTATDFKLAITCINSGLTDSTAILTININSFVHCYCSPNTGVSLAIYGENILSDINIVSTTMNATGITVPSNGYTQLSPAVSTNTAILAIGTSYAITLKTDSNLFTNSYLGGWIDYNQSGNYDYSEFITLTPLSSSFYNGTYVGTINVPTSSLSGQTGMRIMASRYTFINSASPCSNLYDGEIVDLVITISNQCDTVSGLTISYLGSNIITASWLADSAATGYEYIVNTTPSSPTGSGTVTSATSVSISGLTENTMYYVHVRANCGSGYSQWVTIPVTTAKTGVKTFYNNANFNIVAYPNPTKNKITIKISGIKGNSPEIVLTDITGRIIEKEIMSNNQIDLDLSEVASGIYFIQYKDDMNSQTVKVVKE